MEFKLVHPTIAEVKPENRFTLILALQLERGEVSHVLCREISPDTGSIGNLVKVSGDHDFYAPDGYILDLKRIKFKTVNMGF
jgi:hypothetical protein